MSNHDTPATDGKMIVNAFYHSAVISGLTMGYARLGKMAMGGSTPKLDPTPRDVGMVVLDVALVMGTRDLLIKQGIIPADIMNGKHRNARWGRPGEHPCVHGIKLLIHHFEKLWRRRRATIKQSSSCRPRRRHGPGNEPSASTGSTGSSAGKIVLLRCSWMLTPQCWNMRRSPGTTSTPWGPEPQLADFYHPSDGQKDREIAFVILGMATTGLMAY